MGMYNNMQLKFNYFYIIIQKLPIVHHWIQIPKTKFKIFFSLNLINTIHNLSSSVIIICIFFP